MSPIFIIGFLHAPFEFWSRGAGVVIEHVLHALVSTAMMGHAVWIALKNRGDDLVDPRRRFRVVFAVVVGIVGITIAFGESVNEIKELPEYITLVHAIALAALVFFFSFWMLSADAAFFAADSLPLSAGETSAAPTRPAADMPAYGRLMALMEEGVYREEGLTVAILAEKVGVPEHQLRRLINQDLGFRNFSTFLNERRIEEAKSRLADPNRSREQITTLALELGYGSVAPFNRAFKTITGATPTEFRRSAREIR